jgi:hypothetical protein
MHEKGTVVICETGNLLSLYLKTEWSQGNLCRDARTQDLRDAHRETHIYTESKISHKHSHIFKYD